MKLTNGTGRGAVCCQIGPANDIRVDNRLDSALAPETICYAVCRFFAKTPALAGAYAWESYRLRLARGKGRRGISHRCVLPAPLLELPAGWVLVRLRVDPEGVAIRQVSLTGQYPGA